MVQLTRDLTKMNESEIIEYGNEIALEMNKDYIFETDKLFKIYFQEIRRIYQALGGH